MVVLLMHMQVMTMFSNDDKLASAEIQEEVSKCYPDAKPAMLKVACE